MSDPISDSTTPISRTVTKKVYAVETPEGDGAIVRRSIGGGSLKNLTPFLMLDHFHASAGAGFPDHPHRGQATITYVGRRSHREHELIYPLQMLRGSSNHEDSAGHKGVIEAGGVQWMTAGRGIIHSEIPNYIPGKPDPIGLQLWVNLPKKFKMVKPSYQELGPTQIPVAEPVEGLKVRVISGKSHGKESPVRPLGGCWYFHYIHEKEGLETFQELPAGWTTFIYILSGSLVVGTTRPTVFEAFHTLVLSADANETGVLLKSMSPDTQYMLASAEPINEPIVQYGPFVMNTQAEVMQAFKDFREGRNGFEKALTWKSTIAGMMSRR
ncbi:Pirin domain-containing protein [Mycena indigotica]|uniref:Pirin domain-containing protein n=1 Tax=Mycena indigotica TaxID=2126181 RepID=A0A8H6SHC6_9AGAR|nr:Pirin domain-containing protein [Mycena indigotica]KAF7299481.1 Pirin domain-containing protein [Mycena indigotica]